jgi:RimJ/RimL family protein N-acetyltransferase
MSARLQGSAQDLSAWTGAAQNPQRIVMEGRYVRLEPLDPSRHASDLYLVTAHPTADDLYRYLFEPPPCDEAEVVAWAERSAASDDPLFFVVLDKVTGQVGGRQALMRFDANHGVIEIGNILWGPHIARTRIATEALYLAASYAFDVLGCRRFEWKCDNRNEPSKRAAERFGFTAEGVFRNHMVVKGQNRDTAWFSMTVDEWPWISAAFVAWLDPLNFDADGIQQKPLREFRAAE